VKKSTRRNPGISARRGDKEKKYFRCDFFWGWEMKKTGVGKKRGEKPCLGKAHRRGGGLRYFQGPDQGR